MHDLVVIVKADPPGDPVAQDRAQHRAQPGRKQADMAGPDHPAQGDQQDGARNDEGDADKGFRKGDDEGDGKDPIGMGLGGDGDPGARVMHKPMKNAEKHAFACSCYRAGTRPEADIALLCRPYQLPGHFRHISPLQGGYISRCPLRV